MIYKSKLSIINGGLSMKFIIYLFTFLFFLVIFSFVDRYLYIKKKLSAKIRSSNIYYTVLFIVFGIVALILQRFGISVFYPSISSAFIYALLVYFYFR